MSLLKELTLCSWISSGEWHEGIVSMHKGMLPYLDGATLMTLIIAAEKTATSVEVHVREVSILQKFGAEYLS